MTKIKLILAACLMTSLSGIGCSNNESFGDQMINQGGAYQKIGENWAEGDKLVEKGNDMVADGERTEKKGRRSVDKGKTSSNKAIA